MEIEVGPWCVFIGNEKKSVGFNYRTYPILMLVLSGFYQSYFDVLSFKTFLLFSGAAIVVVQWCWLKYMTSQSLFQDWFFCAVPLLSLPNVDVTGTQGWIESLIFGLFIPLWWGAGRARMLWNG